MRDRRWLGAALGLTAYGVLAAWGWWIVWDAHRHGDSSGLEYLPVALFTFPWSLLVFVLELRPDTPFIVGTVLNALLIGGLLARRRSIPA